MKYGDYSGSSEDSKTGNFEWKARNKEAARKPGCRAFALALNDTITPRILLLSIIRNGKCCRIGTGYCSPGAAEGCMGKPELGSFISETARRTATFDLPAPRILMHMVLRYTSNLVKVDDAGFQSISFRRFEGMLTCRTKTKQTRIISGPRTTEKERTEV